MSGITDAMRIAGTDLKRGVLGNKQKGTEVVVDDGVAKLPDFSSYAGSIATMDGALRVLCNDYGFSLPEASVMLSKAPASLLKITDTKGSIEPNRDADLVVFDKDLNLVGVFLKGKLV